MKLDLGISLIGGPKSKDQKYVHITRKDVLKRINEHPAIDPWTRDFLNKKIKDYPDDALIFFVQNINQIVVTALNERDRIMKEQYGEQNKTDKPADLELCGSGGSGTNEVKKAEKVKPVKQAPERESLFAKRPAS